MDYSRVQGWPIYPPDIVVATPAALLNHLFAYDPRRRRRNAFVRDVKYVVRSFKEASVYIWNPSKIFLVLLLIF